jgi:hypothetical protein
LWGDQMPGQEFFARMGPAFSEHAGSAHENAERQADVERLISKAEYECVQLRRELEGLVTFSAELDAGEPLLAGAASEPAIEAIPETAAAKAA